MILLLQQKPNNLGRSDEEQLQWSTQQGRTIYTLNVGDFCNLHKIYVMQGRQHTGIVLGKQTYSIGQQLQGFLYLLSTKSFEEMKNQHEFLGNFMK
ncbi:DUF5615 family PIN-like protein [Lusitaniella coriacea]|uniref:DUF5615 family PIN-like protein n=1 Tax=Lusitaniella coriacea TaxID=1983105 RepID=UPI001D1503D8|nr:DUF5615 family PIN-like protein [Lusitaniella coriacea]